MTKPTFYYMPVLARGQFVTSLLYYFNIDFEHVKLAGGFAKHPEVKEKCTWGQVPLYIDDDIKLCETHAIARYISDKHNFLGKNLIERAKVNEVIESFWDTLNPVLFATFKSDEKGREEFKKDNKVNFLLSCYEKKLNENKYIAGGDDYTYADFGVYVTYDYLNLLGYVDDRKNYPKLESLREHFESLPQMKKYREVIKDQKC